jgi:anti-sigma B factor antagonist
VNKNKFEVNQEKTEEGFILYLQGELDLSTAAQLRTVSEPLAKAEKQTLILNLRELDYIDSTGMGVIISILKTRDQLNAVFAIEEIPPKIQRLFDLTGITKFLNVTKK